VVAINKTDCLHDQILSITSTKLTLSSRPQNNARLTVVLGIVPANVEKRETALLALSR
jgi:hypothetical protein